MTTRPPAWPQPAPLAVSFLSLFLALLLANPARAQPAPSPSNAQPIASPAADAAGRLAAPDRARRLQALDDLLALRPDLQPAAERLRRMASAPARFVSASEAWDRESTVPDPAGPLERLASPQAAERAEAVAELGRMGTGAAEALDRLLAICDDPDPGVRACLARSLPEIRWDARVLGALRTLLKDPVTSVRVAAAHGLGRADAADAVAALRGAMQDPARTVRLQAVVSLGRCSIAGTAAETDLAATLRDRDPEVRRAALRSIGRLGLHEVRTLAELERLLGAPSTADGWAALDALANIGAPARATFARILEISRDPEVRAGSRRKALEALWATADDDRRGTAALRLVEAMCEPDEKAATRAESLLASWIVPRDGP